MHEQTATERLDVSGRPLGPEMCDGFTIVFSRPIPQEVILQIVATNFDVSNEASNDAPFTYEIMWRKVAYGLGENRGVADTVDGTPGGQRL